MNRQNNAVIIAFTCILLGGCIDFLADPCPEGTTPVEQVTPNGMKTVCTVAGPLGGDAGVVPVTELNCTAEESIQSPVITRLDGNGNEQPCFVSLVDDGFGVCIPEVNNGDTVYDCTDSCTSESVMGSCDGSATIGTSCTRGSGLHTTCGVGVGDCGPFPMENPCPLYTRLDATCVNGTWEYTCEPDNFAVCDQEDLPSCETDWVQMSGLWCLNIGEMGTDVQNLPATDVYCTNSAVPPMITSCAFDTNTGCSCISLLDGQIDLSNLGSCPYTSP